MGNIGPSCQRFDVLPLGQLTIRELPDPAVPSADPQGERTTAPNPIVPAFEPMPASYREPTPEPVPGPEFAVARSAR